MRPWSDECACFAECTCNARLPAGDPETLSCGHERAALAEHHGWLHCLVCDRRDALREHAQEAAADRSDIDF